MKYRVRLHERTDKGMRYSLMENRVTRNNWLNYWSGLNQTKALLSAVSR